MHKQDQNGFTLVELLVSIILAGIIIGSLAEVTNTYLHVSQSGRFLNLANSFAEGKIEALRNGGYNNLSTGTTSLTSALPSQLPPNSTASMDVTTPYTGIKKVYLTINYRDQGKIQTYNYVTYIGELGVGQ